MSVILCVVSVARRVIVKIRTQTFTSYVHRATSQLKTALLNSHQRQPIHHLSAKFHIRRDFPDMVLIGNIYVHITLFSPEME